MNQPSVTSPPSTPRSSRVPQRLAGSLLVLTGVTHVVQLAVYGTAGHVLGAVGYGVIYFVLGIAVLWSWKWSLPLAVILPTIGGILGTIRFVTHPNPFSVWHVFLDLIIVPAAVIALRRQRM
ncbi:hypothetical protein ACFVVM_20370 [Nocardia sp. NPDC058176]|uniref:hypothetical protein n=1 Tax=Nocardia sp. NPDC058176 TaxID=3346368 RepID=UPI0036D88862